jgi:RimJ/RimL family protein N-acetyltransferase
LNVKIRRQLVKDASAFYKIINCDDFKYFPVRVPSIKFEQKFLRLSRKNWDAGKSYNFSILVEDILVGGIGFFFHSAREYVVEIGYFISKDYWGKGIAAKSVQLVEDFISQKLPQISRIEIVMAVENKASEKVAKKAGYEKEGTMKKALKIFGKYHDAHLYAKTIGEANTR